MKSTPQAVPKKGVPHQFSSGWEIFQNKQLAGKYKEHLIKIIELLTIRFIRVEKCVYTTSK